MDLWTAHSNQGKQTALSLVCIALGAVLATGFRDSYGPAMTNGMAGLLLGVLLLVIGFAGLISSGKQTVVIDPSARLITVEDTTHFGSKKRSIRFDEIVSVSIGFLGKRSNLVKIYYLSLKLKSGKEYPLFTPGKLYAGATDRSVVEGWKQRLETYLSHL
jgi:hypothetical protein